jgi:sodium transport system ATP-binding protein
MIEARGLAKAFGAIRAVEGVSFTAEDGRITGLLGPNGAGKSTLLRMLATVLRPDAGAARVDGVDVVAHPETARQRLGVLPHGAGLYPHLSARENIAYHAALHGLEGEELEARVAGVIDRLDLRAFSERRTKGFSQGQRTRTALARALVHEPPNVLLDEPTHGLDVMATRALRDVIRGLRDAGKCVLFSSHVMQEVAALCDRVVIVGGGRVRLTGTLDAILEATSTSDLEEAFVRALELGP